MEVTRTAGNVTKGPGTFMVHLAVTDGTTEWAGPVTDDDCQG